MTCKPISLGVAVGALWAFYVLFIGISAMFGWGTLLVISLSSLYIGFSASIIGALIGAVWAFADGFFAGFVIAWIYNKMSSVPQTIEE
ncbi:hypothetical protein MNBD_CPR01-325 [hydrothermal vent metagenome]|uniref:Uncharacterized protein n=1 Tax=hydrothermal vent metagenome TaxID=652676 RepID=A0A3B0VJQ6_9ZZZZ